MNIDLDLGEGSVIPAKLEFKRDQNNLILQCTTKDKNETMIKDNLLQFSTIKVDDENPQRLTLHGDTVDRTYIFQNTIHVSDFFSFLQQNVRVELQAGEARIFSISKKTPQQSGISGYIEKGITGGFNLVKNFVQAPQTSSTSPNNSLKSYKGEDQSGIIETDGLKLGYVDSEFPKDAKITQLTQIPVDLSSIKFSKITIMNREVMMILLSLFKIPQNSLEDYKMLTQQWKNITKGQWDHSFCIRKYVYDVEQSIKNSQCSASPFDEIIFDILMANFSFFFQKHEFDPLTIHFLEVFIKFFISNFDASNETFTSPDGKQMSKEEVESLIFWSFKDFFTKYIFTKSQSYLFKGNLLQKVMKILLKVSPSTAAMIDEFDVKSLTFMKNHPATLFTRERSNFDTILILFAISAAKDQFLFFQSMVAGILIVLQCRLQESESLTDFGNVFDTLVSNIDVRLVLHNAEKIYDIMSSPESESQSDKTPTTQ